MDKDDVAILLEHIASQNQAVLEYVAELPKVTARLDRIERDVTELKQDMKVVKAAVTDVSRQVHDLGTKQHRSSRPGL